VEILQNFEAFSEYINFNLKGAQYVDLLTDSTTKLEQVDVKILGKKRQCLLWIALRKK
jgi:hypothetical protein